MRDIVSNPGGEHLERRFSHEAPDGISVVAEALVRDAERSRPSRLHAEDGVGTGHARAEEGRLNTGEALPDALAPAAGSMTLATTGDRRGVDAHPPAVDPHWLTGDAPHEPRARPCDECARGRLPRRLPVGRGAVRPRLLARFSGARMGAPAAASSGGQRHREERQRHDAMWARADSHVRSDSPNRGAPMQAAAFAPPRKSGDIGTTSEGR
jgi:hypothetical protein